MNTPPEIMIAFNLDRALKLLSSEKSAPLAGGTDLVPGIHQQAKRFAAIERLVDITRIPELKQVNVKNSGTTIGAGVTFSEILTHPRLGSEYPLLTKAAATIGSVQIRNRATIAGNFVNNAPCADSVPPLLVYDAIVRICSLKKSREIPLQEFLLKPYKTQLQTGELVTEIFLPPPPQNFGGDFYKLGRRRGVAISRITLAVLLQTEKKKISGLRIAAGAVTPIGRRFYDIEHQNVGTEISAAGLKFLAVNVGKAILEETGWRWSSPYKLPVTQQIVYQILCKLT